MRRFEKLNILILCSKMDVSGKSPWLTNELIEQFKTEGDVVDVIFNDWSSINVEQSIELPDGSVFLIRPRSNKYGKLHKWLTSGVGMWRDVSQKINRDRYDLIIHFSPAMTCGFLNWIFKRKYKCTSVFILWDFFPYHHYQIGLLPKLLLKPFSLIEKFYIYKSDFVGLMSQRNMEYFNNKYPDYCGEKKIIPIWGPNEIFQENTCLSLIKEKYHIAGDDFVCVFGGQLEAGRGIDSILDIKKNINSDRVKFIILGSGSLKSDVEKRIFDENIKNVLLYDYVPRDEYLALVSACQLGIVATVDNVDVPTFPSKTIDYFRCSIPVISLVEESTDYGTFVEKVACAGYSFTHKQIDEVVNCIQTMMNNPSHCKELGKNGAEYYQANLAVKFITKRLKSALNP